MDDPNDPGLLSDHVDSGLEDTSSEDGENTPEAAIEIPNGNQDLTCPRSNQTFDADLPSLHSYLGSELEVVRGRTVLEENTIVHLEMLPPVDLVLMPGQTLPLTVFDPPIINMLRNCLRDDRTFGVLATWFDGTYTTVNNIGTTAEIYEYLPDEGSDGFRVKAKARQRFKLLDSNPSFSNFKRWKARVKILPEIQLPPALEAVRLQSLNRHRTSLSKQQRCKRADASVTSWPAFVYEQYDADKLITSIKKEFNTTLLQGPKDKDEAFPMKLAIPSDPTELSFWVAQNLPMNIEHRLLLLRLNSPIQRLRWELRALQQCRQLLCCQFCLNVIGSAADIFSMSAEGPQSTYVNPGGFLYETITLCNARNVKAVGPPSTEFSWFPGYAWSICKCKHCKKHMGWYFVATKKKHMRPANFWGICRRSISVKMGPVQPLGDETQQLVF